MSTVTTNHSNAAVRIRRWAIAVRWAAWVTMGAIVATSVYSVLQRTFAWTVGSSSGFMINSHPSPDSVAVPLWLGLAPRAVALYGLVRLAQMMRVCERGEIFSPRVSTHLRAFSASIVIAELLDITQPLQVAAIQGAGQAHAVLSLTVSGEQSWALLVATIFLVLAQILQESARLSEDNASIV
jgi:hypothetical protein